MACVYIIYSIKIDKYYIGSCLDIVARIRDHNSGVYSTGYTKRSDDWKVYFKIDELEYGQSRKIESHIKRMKSRVYIANIKAYPEITEKLKLRYLQS